MRPAEVLYEESVRLAEGGDDQAAADARLLAAHVLGVSVDRLLTLDEISDADRVQIADLVTRRLAGVPVQHLTRKAAFRYLELLVGPGVLIPRPETEWMTGWAIDSLREKDSKLVVELCAGSGAIAKAIATEVAEAEVYANELDLDAYDYLARNLAGTSVTIERSDMLDAFHELDGRVDLVIANPPYIAETDFDALPIEVRDHDPKIALVAGDGLEGVRAVVAAASRLLRPGGLLVIEHGDDQGESAPGVVVDSERFDEVTDHLDLNDRPRFVTATRRLDPPTWTRFDVATEQEAAIEAAVAAVRAGECIVLPTDTVYGIGANAMSSQAVQRLLEAKRRGRDMPPPVLIAEPAMLAAIVDHVPDAAKDLANACWPGALTLICKAQPGSRMDLGDAEGTIAVRVPDHDFTRALLRRTGPLAVSSANVSGRESAVDVDEAIDQLGNTVAVYLDAGRTPGAVASTIVDFVGVTGGRILREGVLDWGAIHEHVPGLEPLERDGDREV